MSKLAQNANKNVHHKKETKLGVKDTDFLLKLFLRSTFDGSELESAHTVVTKLSEMHRVNLED